MANKCENQECPCACHQDEHLVEQVRLACAARLFYGKLNTLATWEKIGEALRTMDELGEYPWSIEPANMANFLYGLPDGAGVVIKKMTGFKL